MRNKFFLLLLIASIFTGCDKDDDETVRVDSEPSFSMLDESISSLPGLNINLKATIEDPAGIRAISIKYEPWFLDKTIEKDSLPKTYNLNYSFKVPEVETNGSQHVITITSINSGGVEKSIDVTVTLDLDVEPPSINILSPADGSTAILGDSDEIQFDITVNDNTSLSTLEIQSEVYNETIQLTGEEYHYQKSLDIETTGNYRFTVIATDEAGNSSTKSVSINIFDELKFEKMFITSLDSDENLKSTIFGSTILMESSEIEDEKGFVFVGKYYAPEPNTLIRFIPQKSSFEPYSFGVDASEPGKLINGVGADINPLTLPEKGYYEIRLDLRDFTYTYQAYAPDDTTYDFIQIIATGIIVDGESTCKVDEDDSFRCFHFTSGKPLVQDSENPYRFSANIEIFDEPDSEGANGMILNANKAGWGPFWRFDENNAVPQGGSTLVFSEDQFGSYRFVFDTHLNSVTITPLN
ncbi:hypothetical protein ACNKXS_04450 [Christiangramia marina]|uniref:hypothetical protein n=1 Tax=Christiangramia marina TaxID=409436 RepID=UPI003AA9AAC4